MTMATGIALVAGRHGLLTGLRENGREGRMSDDLISRTALMQSLRNNVLVDVTPNLEQAIAEQPTAYDVDKVVEQLEKYPHGKYSDDYGQGFSTAMNLAIRIVKSGGIE